MKVPDTKVLTLADLLDLFGPIPAHRIGSSAPPGTATEDDVVEAAECQDRRYELVQGVLVEKTTGLYVHEPMPGNSYENCTANGST